MSFATSTLLVYKNVTSSTSPTSSPSTTMFCLLVAYSVLCVLHFLALSLSHTLAASSANLPVVSYKSLKLDDSSAMSSAKSRSSSTVVTQSKHCALEAPVYARYLSHHLVWYPITSHDIPWLSLCTESKAFSKSKKCAHRPSLHSFACSKMFLNLYKDLFSCTSLGKRYSITKSLIGERRKQETGVMDKQGVLRTETRERLGRDGWSTLVTY